MTAFGPTWYAATMVAAPERPRLTADIEVDICVVGGGLAGLTVAREAARRGRSVALLETRRIAWNASGRNSGFVRPGFAEQLHVIIERVGLERARELWALSVQGADYVRAAIRDTGMPGVRPVDGYLGVSKVDGDAQLMRHTALLREAFGAEVELWPTDRVREVLRSKRYFQALHWPRAFHIHPLNYALGLAAAAERSGARIFEDTSALAIDVSGVRKRVDTGEGRVRAQHIVLAGGALLGPLVPAAAGTLVPIAARLAVTAPLGERLGEAIRYPGAVAEARLSGNHYRVVDGGRLLWGAGVSTRLSDSRGAHRIAGRIRTAYPQLGPVEVAHAWSGVIAYAVHRMPQVGEVVPGVWLVNAFGDLGLNTTAMAGELIARAMIEGDDRWRLFSRYELVWAGGSVGSAITELLLRAAGVLERADPTISRFRTAGRRAAEHATRGLAKAAGEAAHVAIDGANALLATVRRRQHAVGSSTVPDAARNVHERISQTGHLMSTAAIAHNAEILRDATMTRSMPPASLEGCDGEPTVQPLEVAPADPVDASAAASPANKGSS